MLTVVQMAAVSSLDDKAAAFAFAFAYRSVIAADAANSSNSETDRNWRSLFLCTLQTGDDDDDDISFFLAA